MSANDSTIRCPECGTQNRPGSVFCAECGAMLPQPENDDTGATASFTPVETSPEHSGDAWHPDDAGTTQIFTPQVNASEPLSGETTWSPPVAPTPAAYIPDPGRRGFVLGVIATIMILLVFGFFLWSTVVSDGFRETITGLF